MAVDKKGKTLPTGIRQRSDGKYEGRVQHELDRYSVYGNTLAEVKRKKKALSDRLERGEDVANSRVTLNEWFKTWMEQYKRDLKDGSKISYNDYFEYYIKDRLGKKKVVEISGEHIQRLYNELVDKGLAPSSIKIVSAILSGCLKQAMKNRLIELNPVTLANLPRRKEKEEPRVLTREEQRIFMEYAKDSYLYNMFDLALKTGLRSGEVRGLKLIDVDKGANVLQIRRTLKYATGRGFFESTPKTRKSKRDIPLRKDMMDIIDKERQVYGEEHVLRMEGYIFCLPNGGPISRGRYQNEIDRIIKKITDAKIEFERFTPHCLRHTFATRAAEEGMKPEVLKEIMGHENIAITMDLYYHNMKERLADEMNMVVNGY